MEKQQQAMNEMKISELIKANCLRSFDVNEVFFFFVLFDFVCIFRCRHVFVHILLSFGLLSRARGHIQVVLSVQSTF